MKLLNPYHVLKKFAHEVDNVQLWKKHSKIEFSRRFYQIYIHLESDLGHWVFLQLDEDNFHIKDAFCNCDQDENGCPHIACAIKLVFEESQPIHVQFEDSFWFDLCLSYSYLFHLRENTFYPNKKNEFIFESEDQEVSFFIKLKDAQACEEFLEVVKESTSYENSLKYAVLSEEQLEAVKKGIPSLEVRYELSVWSELAKYLFLHQREKKMQKAEFILNSKHYPCELRAFFDRYEVVFKYRKKELLSCYQKISQLPSNINCLEKNKNGLISIEYHPSQKSLFLYYENSSSENKMPPEEEKDIVKIGSFYFDFIHFRLFSSEKKEKLKLIPEENLEFFLNSHMDLFKTVPCNFTIKEKEIKLRYYLYFDADWNFHIIPYLKEVHDLNHPDVILRKSFLYFPEENTFYFLSDNPIFVNELVIEETEVSVFIAKHVTFLNHFESFKMHLSRLSYQMNYFFNEKGDLCFLAQEKHFSDKDIHDFGEFTYILGLGFYRKYNKDKFAWIKSEMIVPKEQIGAFIIRREHDLIYVDQFFVDSFSINKAGIIFHLTQKYLEVIPFYHFEGDVDRKDFVFFDGCIYIKNHGFYIIPKAYRLPKKFFEKQMVPFDLIEDFFEKYYDQIEPFIDYQNSNFRKVDKGAWTVKKIKSTFSSKIEVSLVFRLDQIEVSVQSLVDSLQKGKRFYCKDQYIFDLYEKKFSFLSLIEEVTVSNKAIINLFTFLNLLIAEPMYIEYEGLFQKMTTYHLKQLIFKNSPTHSFSIKGLKSNLRDYQKVGINWLWSLKEHGLSGILCDDMGLGKTHQAMALMQAIFNENRKKSIQILIICPTSVLFHWQEKLAAFLTEATVQIYYGKNRELVHKKDFFMVLLTTYGVMRKDYAVLSKTIFDLVVYDELQLAKNASSKIYKALAKIHAKMFLGLTGTPIENNLMELKSLFDLILNGLFPDEKIYREQFLEPIEIDQNSSVINHVKELINPFILRRTKSQVLKELPEKIEDIIHCELSSDQVQLYESVLYREENQIKGLQQHDKAVAYVHIFSILTKLKQICNHPACYLQSPADYKDYRSGKWEVFVDLLHQSLDSGKKVVVFTQYLDMIAIFARYLTEQNIAFVQLQGSTVDRKKEVKRFQEDPECRVFIGSLQAAGLGIDLNAAQVVIHYDRWWNPARENQATDRVHRMGQTRGVQVFKLVTLNSLEVKIDQIIERKNKLFSNVVGISDTVAWKVFSREDLIDIFSWSKFQE